MTIIRRFSIIIYFNVCLDCCVYVSIRDDQQLHHRHVLAHDVNGHGGVPLRDRDHGGGGHRGVQGLAIVQCSGF